MLRSWVHKNGESYALTNDGRLFHQFPRKRILVSRAKLTPEWEPDYLSRLDARMAKEGFEPDRGQ